ncbi:MAG TPA: efflux transporter outer membrane subunit [Steroidobacteraceae bacterium]|nr:efflux transporter outer membrane subunit [Steroidobacteraceae bacterium]
MLAGLAACSVGPAYRRPEVPLPPSWSSAAQGATAAWPAAEWWRAFGSPALDDYVSQARLDGDDIAAAIARVREADAQARIAGAALLPAVGFDASATRERAIPLGGGAAVTANQFSPEVTASYELDFWGKNRATRDAAALAAQASRFDQQTVTLTVIAGVAQNYFQALEMHDRLQVAQNDLANAQHTLDGLTLEQQVGTATALDVAQQASVVAVVNASIPPLREQLQQSLNALAVLLGRAPETIGLGGGGLGQIRTPPVIAGLPSQLLARRPDVAEAEAQLHAANANIVAARAAFFPNVDLTGSGGFASAVLGTLVSPASRVFAVTGALSQSIFQGGALRGQYQYSRARYAELLSDYHKTVMTALSDVENALIAVQQAADQQQRQQNATDKAQRAFDFAQMQMAAGTTNILTVLNTETTLFTAQDELVQVKFQHLQTLVQLYQALGGGWQVQQAKL